MVLSGVLMATYVTEPRSGAARTEGVEESKAAKLGIAGAMTWVAPLQPILAIVPVVLMAAALRIRLKNQWPRPVTPSSAR